MKFKRLPFIILIFLIIVCLPNTTYAQSGGFTKLSATVNIEDEGSPVQMSVSLTLPDSSLPINTSDYILISLPHFSNVAVPTGLSGTYAGGSPQFSVSGTTIKITNISVNPGSILNINGITAINPGTPGMMVVRVVVAEDEAGTLIKNFGEVFATSTAGSEVVITASIVSPQSRVIINGYTSPGSFVTYTEGEAVIGTLIAGLNGYFSKVYSAINPGDHQISIYSVDRNNLSTSPIILSLYAPAYSEVTVSDQLLSPTISINQTVFAPGDPIIASGSARPNTNITLFTEAPLRSYATSADIDGNWTYTINDTASYYLGDYHIHALTQTQAGITSINSPSIGFSITTSGTPEGEACGDISNGNLNCDAIIDLTDFSILMYYWGTNNATADINISGLVDLTDFSIMMYWWGSS